MTISAHIVTIDMMDQLLESLFVSGLLALAQNTRHDHEDLMSRTLLGSCCTRHRVVISGSGLRSYRSIAGHRFLELVRDDRREADDHKRNTVGEY